MTTSLETLLERLKPVARDEIVRVLGQPNVCIPTCRVLQGVLKNFSFDSYPVPTEVSACNKVQAEIFRSMGGREQAANATPEQRDDWARRGGYAVAVGPGIETAGLPVRNDGWNGHLVLRVEDILLDGSIEMLNDSSKDLILPELLWTPANAEWEAGTQYACLTLSNGCEVIYGRLNNDIWRSTPYWKADSEPYKTMQNKMVESILAKLKPQAV